ncbi:ATP-binding cassette-type vacuolar membrane transporter-like protein Hmt1, partial [Saccharata proteae CBS 121410]
FVGEAVLFIVHSLQERGWWAEEHNVLFVMTSILVWGCLAVILLESPFPRWLPYLGAWILGLVLEAVIFALTATSPTERDVFSDARLAIMALRLAVLFMLSVTGIVMASTVARAEESTDEESQPLLGNGHVAQPDAGQYGAIPVEDDPKQADTKTGAEDEDEDEDKDVKEKQRKRLMEHGGWWGYLKGFFIFLPLIWPARNRKMQFYLFIIGLCVVFQRALNVLIPNQLGVITNKLALVSGTGLVPWREISLWIAFRFLSSRAGIDGVQSLLTTHLEQFSYLQITKAAFRHVMGLSMDFHTEKNSGELLKAVEQGYSLTQLLDYVVFDTIPLLVDLIVAFFFLSNLFDVYLAFTVIVVAITFFWTTIKLTAYNRESRRLYVDKYLKENKIMYESVSNWQTVAYFNRRKHEEERLDKAVKEHIDAYVRYNWSYNMIFAVQALVILFGLLVASFLAAYRIALNERTVGSFVTLVGYWSTLSSPLSRLANSYNRLASDLIDAERMLQLFNTKSNIEDKEDAQPLQITEGRVDFENVEFAYDKRKSTLKDITFTAESGKTVALVGETGSGKSTTLKLLLRFYDVTAGSIKIDGQDIRDVQLHSLREAMGVVPQDPSMFNMSIMENIRYARLDASDEEVHEACRAAAVHDKILTFPDGYSTKVGERGVKLSGGELQRVAIARVLLKNPQLVLLDEATSAVDSATEIQIQEAFKRLSKGRTTFIIAHRLSTIMDADLILVIENGQIIERGTQQELLGMGGKYVDLWTKQTS